jgi:pectate lyase
MRSIVLVAVAGVLCGCPGPSGEGPTTGEATLGSTSTSTSAGASTGSEESTSTTGEPTTTSPTTTTGSTTVTSDTGPSSTGTADTGTTDTDTGEPIDPLADTPIGYATLEGGTIGGAGGPTVVVTTYEELEDAAEGSDDPLIIKIDGTIVGDTQILVRSNKTILGLPGSKLQGVGLRLSEVNNVILRNLTIEGVVADLGDGDQDAITLKYGTHHVWIDHCDLRAQPVGEPFEVDGDSEYYDGLLDITRGCDFISVSWTRFADSWKAVLVGGGSGEVENIGKQHLTMYNNYILDCLERGPYVGLSEAHVFNNYTRVTALTGHVGNGISLRDNAQVRVDDCYFDHTLINDDGMSPSVPIITGYPTSVGGPGVVTNLDSNIFVGTVDNQIETPPGDFVPPYEYAPIPAEQVPDVVAAGAGATLKFE